MHQIQIINQITQTENGPTVTDTIKTAKPQLIHMQQGSLDGACGPYCLCMALVALGFENHTKLTVLSDSKTSKYLFSQIAKRSAPLVKDGTTLATMIKYVKGYKKLNDEIIFDKISAKKDDDTFNHKSVEKFVIDHLKQDHLVMLASQHHWVLVIGLEYQNQLDGNQDPRLFLVLDPSASSPTLSPWNGVIDISIRGKGNKWFGSGNYAFYDALAIWK